MRFDCLVLLAASIAVGCGGAGSGNAGSGNAGDSDAGSAGSSGGGGAKGSGPVLWSASHTSKLLQATDSGTGRTLAMIELPADPNALALGAGKVFVGTDDGDVRAVDTKSFEVLKTLHVGGPIEHIAVGKSEVFVAHFGGGSSGLPPQIVRIDETSLEEVARFAVVDVNESHDGLLLDGSSLLVLVGNGFAIERVDPQTGTVNKKVALGQDPMDPSGPRGDFYGYGSMVAAGSHVLVLDESNDQVLVVDPSALEVTAIHDAASWLKNGGATHLTTDGADAFVSLADSDSIVRLAGQDGTLAATYPIKQGAGPIAWKDGRLYMDGDETFGDVLVIEAKSGTVLRTVPGVFADNLLAVE